MDCDPVIPALHSPASRWILTDQPQGLTPWAKVIFTLPDTGEREFSQLESGVSEQTEGQEHHDLGEDSSFPLSWNTAFYTGRFFTIFSACAAIPFIDWEAEDKSVLGSPPCIILTMQAAA